MTFRWHKLTDDDEGMFNKIKVSSDDIPVCLEVFNPENKDKAIKTFAVFRSAHQFLNYIADTPIMKRCYFEIIRGSHAQKHYVDIDIPLVDDDFTEKYSHTKEEKQNIALKVVKMYVDILLELKKEISLYDVLVFNSNSDLKRSYHIIIDRWYLPSATQNKELFRQVMERIPLQYHKYFDDRMYKSIQQFRTMFSTKCGKNRFKVIDKQSTWKLSSDYQNDTMKVRELFYASLVTEVIGNCKMMSFDYKEKIAYVPSREINNIELEIVIRAFRQNFKDASTFDVREPKDSLIPLLRRRSSYCDVCQKNHDSENPYLYVNFQNKLFYNCHRNDKSVFLTDLNTAEDGSIVNNKGDEPSTVYVPPTIEPRRQKIMIKPFVDSDFMDMTERKEETVNRVYPHMMFPSEVEEPKEKAIEIPDFMPKTRVIKVTQQEKLEHQMLIDAAKAKYNKSKPKLSINDRLAMTHHKIALT